MIELYRGTMLVRVPATDHRLAVRRQYHFLGVERAAGGVDAPATPGTLEPQGTAVAVYHGAAEIAAAAIPRARLRGLTERRGSKLAAA